MRTPFFELKFEQLRCLFVISIVDLQKIELHRIISMAGGLIAACGLITAYGSNYDNSIVT